MKILIVGGGGREHALAYACAKSPRVDIVYAAPGNPGTAQGAKMQNVPISVDDLDGLLHFAQEQQIDLTIVGPEAPLVAGIVDKFTAAGLKIFGPSGKAAQLEGSKSFAKAFLKRHHIPTAAFEVFSAVGPAEAYIKEKGAPIVVKADGLAAGKGVIVAMTEKEAIKAVHDMLEDNAFGDAGARVVIEEFMQGEEASFIVLCDSINALPLASSQDHKRIFDHDEGPNTGGMGAYSPAPVVTEEVYQRVMDEIINPTLQGMREDGLPYTGFLYAGLMIDKNGAPRVVEFNCRMGDPETQPLLLRLQSDLPELCLKACTPGGLQGEHCAYDPRPAVGVVLSAHGYPGKVRKGDVISGLDADFGPDVMVFQAGTAQQSDQVVTAGGRVLCVTALGQDIADAKARAYEAVAKIHFDGMFCRRDIADKALHRPQ